MFILKKINGFINIFLVTFTVFIVVYLFLNLHSFPSYPQMYWIDQEENSSLGSFQRKEGLSVNDVGEFKIIASEKNHLPCIATCSVTSPILTQLIKISDLEKEWTQKIIRLGRELKLNHYKGVNLEFSDDLTMRYEQSIRFAGLIDHWARLFHQQNLILTISINPYAPIADVLPLEILSYDVDLVFLKTIEPLMNDERFKKIPVPVSKMIVSTTGDQMGNFIKQPNRPAGFLVNSTFLKALKPEKIRPISSFFPEPPKNEEAPPLSEIDQKYLQEFQKIPAIKAHLTAENNIQIGPITINRMKKQLEIPVAVNLSSGIIEVILCHPENGRLHESLLLTYATPFQLQIALYLLNLKNGPFFDANQPQKETGDVLELLIHPFGDPHPVSIDTWLLEDHIKKNVSQLGYLFVGSCFKENQCLANMEGNLVNINSQDLNTILCKILSKEEEGMGRFTPNPLTVPQVYVSPLGKYKSKRLSDDPNLITQPYRDPHLSADAIQGILIIRKKQSDGVDGK